MRYIYDICDLETSGHCLPSFKVVSRSVHMQYRVISHIVNSLHSKNEMFAAMLKDVSNFMPGV